MYQSFALGAQGINNRVQEYMSSLIPICRDFNCAVKQTQHDPAFSQRPSLMIEDQTFRDLFAPIRDVMEGNRFRASYNLHAGHKAPDVPEMIEEMRRMCLEAQLSHTTRDGCTRGRRTELLNILESIKERAEEGVNPLGMRSADMDFFSLPDLTDVIRESAMTHSEFLHNPDVSNALMNVADRIESAQKRLWRPEAQATPIAAYAAADSYYAQAAVGAV